MESPLIEKITDKEPRSSTSSNQLFITDNLDLPDDTFRMSLDNYSVVGENVTISDRDISTDVIVPDMDTPTHEVPTPLNTPCSEVSPSDKSPPIIETPKREEIKPIQAQRRPQDLLKLSLVKNSDNDVFVKPSPVCEVMSPAKMLQFEINTASSATPTMKRAAIDFDFFNKNNFEEYFDDVPKIKEEDKSSDDSCKKTTVIVKADTVRYEIGYESSERRRCRYSQPISVYEKTVVSEEAKVVDILGRPEGLIRRRYLDISFAVVKQRIDAMKHNMRAKSLTMEDIED